MFEPVRVLFIVLHLVGFGAFSALLFWPRWRAVFERRCLGTATATDLGFVRVVTCATLALYVLTEDLPSYARLGATFMHPVGYFNLLGSDVFSWWFMSSTRLWLVSLGTLLLSLLGAVGWRTRVTLPLAAGAYLFFAALLRAPGKAFHEGYLAWYVLLVLACLPAGDALSLDARSLERQRERAAKGSTAPAYAWMVWACQAAAAVPYLQLSLSKWWSGGPFWFDGRSLRNYMLADDLNLTQWNIDLALRAYRAPTLVFTLSGLFGLLVESLYPLALLVPRLRLVLPLAVAFLHLGVWFMQDALFLDAVLIPLIFCVPSRWPGKAQP